MPDALETHYETVLDEIMKGSVVPFLGAGVNLCGRPKGTGWLPSGGYLPSGRELAEFLAKNFRYPDSADAGDLVRVCQYAAVDRGTGPLYDELRKIFAKEYSPTPVHRFFANLRNILRSKGYPAAPTEGYELLIVTTNYDDLLERAFQDAGEPYDLVSYVAEGEHRGKFLHTPPGGEAKPIEIPNEYKELSLDRRAVILKIHGAVNRDDKDADSFVITEDDYINFLARSDISKLIPAVLLQEMLRSHFLFLGYSLRDWNLRVILHRIWREQKLSYHSWSIQMDPTLIDQKLWQKREVDILDVSLDKYIEELGHRLAARTGLGHAR